MSSRRLYWWYDYAVADDEEVADDAWEPLSTIILGLEDTLYDSDALDDARRELLLEYLRKELRVREGDADTVLEEYMLDADFCPQKTFLMMAVRSAPLPLWG